MRDDPPSEWRCPQCGYPNTGSHCRDCGYEKRNDRDLERLADMIADRLKKRN